MSHQTFRLRSLTSFFIFVPSSLLHLRSLFTSSLFVLPFHIVFTLFTSSLLHCSFFTVHFTSSLFVSAVNSWKPLLHLFLLRVAPCISGFHNFELFFFCFMFFLCFIYLFIYLFLLYFQFFVLLLAYCDVLV